MCLVHTHEAADARSRRRALSHVLGAVLATLAVLASAAPAIAAWGPLRAAPVERDLRYGPRASQVLDLYLPPVEGEGRTAVVLIHGGAWAGAGKGIYDTPPGGSVAPQLARRLAARGMVVAAIDYTHGNIPAQVQDVRRALRWMRASGPRLGIDPERTVAWGDSAGGHLALLAAIHGWAGAAVAWSAPTDLRAFAPRMPPGFLEQCIRCAAGDCPERWSALSPLRAAARLRVPVLLVNTRRDPLVRLAESALPLRAANPDHVRLRVIPSAGHAYMPEAFAPSVAFVRGLWRTPAAPDS